MRSCHLLAIINISRQPTRSCICGPDLGSLSSDTSRSEDQKPKFETTMSVSRRESGSKNGGEHRLITGHRDTQQRSVAFHRKGLVSGLSDGGRDGRTEAKERIKETARPLTRLTPSSARSLLLPMDKARSRQHASHDRSARDLGP
jgi:hypothetical protein